MLKIFLEEKDEVERLILLLNIGVINAIKEGAFTLDEAMNYFHSPYTAQTLEEIGVSKKVIDLIYECCLLEDIESIIPEKISKSLNRLSLTTIDLLKEVPKAQLPTKYWVEE